jgi:hypothetical protein
MRFLEGELLARFASLDEGKGKSGGYRVISFYSGTDVPVFLLTVFSKGEKANLTKAQRNELKAILADIVREYRRGPKRHV